MPEALPQEPTSATGDHATRDRRCGQAYALVILSFLLLVSVGVTAQHYWPIPGLATTELICILLPAVVFVRWKGLSVANGLRWKPISASTTALSVAIGICGWGVALLIHLAVTKMIGPDPAQGAFDVSSVGALLAMILAGAILPGICEETLFRGAVQGVLERRGTVFAVLVAAAIFGTYHINPWTIVPAMFLGIVLGTIVVRTGSTVASILAHTLNNATAFTVAYLFRDQPEEFTYRLAAGLAVGFLIFATLFWRHTLGSRTAPAQLASVPAQLPRFASILAGLTGLAVLGFSVVVIGALTVFRVHTVGAEASSLPYAEGDIAIVALDKSFSRSLEAGDIVLFVDQENDRSEVLGEVLRAADYKVWIADGETDREIRRDFVLGKVVYHVEIESD